MSPHFVQGFKLAVALAVPVVATLVFRARALAATRTIASVSESPRETRS